MCDGRKPPPLDPGSTVTTWFCQRRPDWHQRPVPRCIRQLL